MELDIFSLCDHAQDLGGKLCLIGTFDTLFGLGFPVLYPACAIALRARFSRPESGPHDLAISIVDEDGRNVMPERRTKLDINMAGGDDFSTANMAIGLGRLRFERPGRYFVDLTVDGRHKRSLPLVVRKQ